jgi:hypothetical protein
MTVYVVALSPIAGGWQALLPDSVQGPEDLDRLATLEGAEVSREPVLWGDEWLELPVHRLEERAYVRLEDGPESV